jgi:hypothetical protein
MGSVPPVLSFLLMIAAGWVHRQQLIVIEFLQAENRLLKERLRGRRIMESVTVSARPLVAGPALYRGAQEETRLRARFSAISTRYFQTDLRGIRLG